MRVKCEGLTGLGRQHQNGLYQRDDPGGSSTMTDTSLDGTDNERLLAPGLSRGRKDGAHCVHLNLVAA